MKKKRYLPFGYQMNEGNIIFDVSGEEKKNLHVSDLLKRFEDISSDRMLLA